MSNNCLAGFPAFGPRVDTSITYHPVEYIPESPIVLPSALPDTAQVQFTINAASLPTWNPVYPILHGTDNTFSNKYAVYTIMGFHNSGAASATIYPYYKSANPSTFSSAGGGPIGAGKYKTICTRYSITALALNDVHEFKLYTGATSTVELLWAYVVVVPNYLLKMGDTTVQNRVIDLEIDISQASWIGATNVQTPSSGWDTFFFLMRDALGNATDSGCTANLRTSAYQGPKTIPSVMRAPNASTNANVVWASDRSTDDKYHRQPYYPTRVAYTPIL